MIESPNPVARFFDRNGGYILGILTAGLIGLLVLVLSNIDSGSLRTDLRFILPFLKAGTGFVLGLVGVILTFGVVGFAVSVGWRLGKKLEK